MPLKKEETVTVDLTMSDAASSQLFTVEPLVKRQRALASEIARPFVCSISQDLMIDPVSAEDGNTYDRCGIEQ